MRRISSSVNLRLLGFWLISVLVLLGALEGILRLVWREPEGMLPADRTEGWKLPKGKTIPFSGTMVRINSLGYRGPEVTVEKPSGTFRIYASGDSSVFGDGIPEGKTFISLTAECLSGRLSPGLTVEPVNGGVPGFSTYQSLARLEESGWAFSPDMLVIANLWSDAAPSDVSDRELLSPGTSYPRSKILGRVDTLLSNTALSRFIKSALLEPWRIGRVDIKRPAGELQRRVPLGEYKANLAVMVEEAKARGVLTQFLVLPHTLDQLDVRGENLDGMREGLRHHGFTEVEQEHRNGMRMTAEEMGVPLLDVPSLISASVDDIFLDVLHPNEEGNELIAQHLCRVLLKHPGLSH